MERLLEEPSYPETAGQMLEMDIFERAKLLPAHAGAGGVRRKRKQVDMEVFSVISQGRNEGENLP